MSERPAAENSPELRCFGSGCTPARVYETEGAAADHENQRHGGANTVFLVVPADDGFGWAIATATGATL